MQTFGQDNGKTILRDKINNVCYTKGKLLGTGGFAKCYQAISQQDNHLYAAKVIPKKSVNDKRQRYKLLVEIKIHRSLKHKHIVEFLKAFEDRQNIYILLEYCRNYTLKDLVKRRKRLTEFETRTYVSQVVKALAYIHQAGIIHRDLKLGNILINDQMDAKICDFGLSTRIRNEGDVKKTVCGTPNYIAPEILEEQGHSYEVDIWSIGVIMYTLLFGKPPFEDNTVEQTYENIKSNRYIFPSHIKISMAAKDLISRILVMDPARRLSLTEILDHEFIKISQDIPHTLPLSSLAVPPIEQDKLPVSIQLREVQQDESEQISHQMQTNAQSRLQSQINQINFVYILECFKHESTIGYLLSNGRVGIYLSNSRNLVLDYGQKYYLTIDSLGKKMKQPVPDEDEFEQSIRRLFYFKSYFNQKYSIFKLQEMRKRSIDDKEVFIAKEMSISQFEITTRLSNNIVQLHFSDLTSMAIVYGSDDDKDIYFFDRKGRGMRVNYGQVKKNIQVKVRRFSRLLQRITPQESESFSEEYMSNC